MRSGVILCALLASLFSASTATATDTCAGAVSIPGGTPIIGNLSGSSASSPTVCSIGGNNADHWFHYVASCDGEVTISTCGTHDIGGVDAGMDTILAVYDACGGVEIACNDDDDNLGVCTDDQGILRDSAVRLTVTTGTQLLIRLSHFPGFLSTGDYILSVDCEVVEPPVTNLACTPGPGPDDFQLTWNAPAGNTATEISILSDESGIATLIGSVSPTTTTFVGSLATPGASGLFEFCVEVRGSMGASRWVCCSLRFNPPPNDACHTAIEILPPGGSVLFDNTLATTVGLQIDSSLCDPPWHIQTAPTIFGDLWYEYTATTTGPLFASTCNAADFDTKIAIYEKAGCPAIASDLITCNDDAAGCSDFTSRVTWDAVVGTTYLVQVGSWDSTDEARGSGQLIVSQEKPAVTNLSCAHGSTPGEFNVTFDYPVGNQTDEVRIYMETLTGPMFLGSVLHPATTFTGSIENPELVGTVDICAEAIGVGISQFECCTLTFSGFLNDSCVTPLVIGDGVPAAIGDLSYSTTGGTTNCAIGPALDAWYAYTAGCGGPVTFTTCGSYSLGGLDTVLSIHSACPGTVANQIGCSDDDVGQDCRSSIYYPWDSYVTVNLAAGQTVYVRIGHYPQPGSLGSGRFQLNVIPSLIQLPVLNLSGTDLGGGQFELDYELPVGPTITALTVWSDETGSSQPYVFPTSFTPPFVGQLIDDRFVGDIEFCITLEGACGMSTQVCTTVPFSGIPNDSCVNPTAIASPASGPVPFVNTDATTNSPPIDTSVCSHWLGNDTIDKDLWYEYTATTTGDAVARLCGSSFDTKIAVWEAGLCPPQQLIACNADSCGLQSEVFFPVSPGSTYLIQVGSFSVTSSGNGVLEVEQACPRPLHLSAAFDCATGHVSIWWTDQGSYTSIEVRANGVPLLMQPQPVGAGVANSFDDLNPPSDVISYEVIVTCAQGGSSSDIVTVDATQVAPSQDLIFALEGLQSAGAPLGEVDSGMRLKAALEANGRTVALLRASPRGYPCLADLLTSAENIWVLLGTYPTAYTLDQTVLGEAVLLHDLVVNGGMNLYIEGGDYLGFNHTPSVLDDIDGIDLDGVEDGNNSFNAMIGQDAQTAEFHITSVLPGVHSYRQDSIGNEWTDRYSLAGPGSTNADPGVVSAEVIWRNHGSGEPPYITGVIATTPQQRRVVTQSWEFGGFDGDEPSPVPQDSQQELAGVFLASFAAGVPSFERADCNNDQQVNIADAVATLNYLFPSGCTGSGCAPLPCESACDANDDGAINIADAVMTLSVLFPSGGCTPGLDCPTFSTPTGGCGTDGTNDGLACDNYSCP